MSNTRDSACKLLLASKPWEPPHIALVKQLTLKYHIAKQLTFMCIANSIQGYNQSNPSNSRGCKDKRPLNTSSGFCSASCTSALLISYQKRNKMQTCARPHKKLVTPYGAKEDVTRTRWLQPRVEKKQAHSESFLWSSCLPEVAVAVLSKDTVCSPNSSRRQIAALFPCARVHSCSQDSSVAHV